MFLYKSNFLMRKAYPDFLWRKPNLDKKIYLTFDDGPIPEITEFVLEQLQKYQAKATFFCIGDNIRKNSLVFQKLINSHQQIGNHTFNHLNGWKNDKATYLDNFEKCEEILSRTLIQNNRPKLFRPPYGRISKHQAKAILPTHTIVMWDVLTGDFSQDLMPETVLRKSLKYTEEGSIVVFHDSQKAWKNMSYTLPRLLEHFSEKGYQFDIL
jgi:peptidoglycan-N-acetylglucosamine deacetylase